MIEVRASADVARPAGEVFDDVADMENDPRWRQGQESCTWTSPSFEVVEYESGRRIRLARLLGPA